MPLTEQTLRRTSRGNSLRIAASLCPTSPIPKLRPPFDWTHSISSSPHGPNAWSDEFLKGLVCEKDRRHVDVIRAQLLISSTSAALGTDSNKRARTIGGKAESVAHDANVFELPFSRAG